jgi:hypothetical protein
MSIVRYPHTCIVVHLADAEAHLDTAAAAEQWIERLDPAIKVHAIEDAQQPCWTAHCDTQDCLGQEDDEHGNTMHFPAPTAGDAEHQLSDLQRMNDGQLLCYACREGTKPVHP